MNAQLETKLSNYSFKEHVHRYAVWTAARAVSRDFTTTANIKLAIEATNLREFVDGRGECNHEAFEQMHRKWAKDISDFLSTKVDPKKSTYGRAAKVISIYLKTAVIISENGLGAISEVIHPPIDAILLNEIAKITGKKKYALRRWTKLDDTEYWSLVSELREDFPSFNWKIECCWSPERETTVSVES